ncbi:MAG: DNA-3-methyladenine glycosylase [Planctomycetaceae bacterium]|nr:DNA-3-methyladenine glycosylase [Planctomycetaceae bacterium]
MPRGTILNEAFYSQPVTQVAEALCGMVLMRQTAGGLMSGRIVETEAYLAAGDSASHSFRGPGRKNASMFGPPGRAYVYTIHARQCFNVVTEAEHVGSAVLIRAVQPLEGLETMQLRRKMNRIQNLCRGPARLCEAFDIGREHDGHNLTTGEDLWIADLPGLPSLNVAQSPRIGVTSNHEALLRFYVADNTYVSGPRRLNQAF